MRTDRFAYEYAEKSLDDYMNLTDSVQLIRAYKQFKWTVFGVAYVDFGHRPDEIALSHAWENAQIAFYGYGDKLISGSVQNLWTFIPKGERNKFEQVVYKAFQDADDNTTDRLSRRYMVKWRRKPVRRPEQGFDLPYVMPIGGPRLREWATDNLLDPDMVEEELRWFEKADRELNGRWSCSMPDPAGEGPFPQIPVQLNPTK